MKEKHNLNSPWTMFERNGWKRIGPLQRKDEFEADEYGIDLLVMDYHKVKVSYLWNLTLCGDIGIGWIEATPDDNGDHEYMGPHDCEHIIKAIEYAENNLLNLGIPFTADYKFKNDPKKRKAKENERNRKRIDMDAFIRKMEETERERERKRKERAEAAK